MRSRRTGIACLAVGLVALMAGIGQAFLWAAIAPHQRWIVYKPDPERFPDGHNYLPLPTENVDRFTSIGMFAMMSVVIGVVIGVAAWQIRFARGLTMLLAAGIGCAAGSVLALLIGPAMAGGVLPAVLAPTADRDQLVSMPITISWTVAVVAPMLALVVYTMLAAWHPELDLGSRRAPAAPADPSGSTGPNGSAGPSGSAGTGDLTGPAADESVTVPIPTVQQAGQGAVSN